MLPDMSGPGMPNTVKSSYNRPPAQGKDPWSPTDTSLGGFWEGGRHWSAVTADDAIDFLGEAKAGEKPAFFYVAFNCSARSTTVTSGISGSLSD